ncbi:ABC transporter ATP-binding protein [Aeromicrobium sp. CTD01-1L150]|uniref:ABC transporter ATP-binding protein n=1 Tax=Aeromicrobium sp. CTD01-1L150 TaxID=3341830 RepID=UPI0035C199A6
MATDQTATTRADDVGSVMSVRDLVIQYKRAKGGPLTAVDGVGFDVNGGEIVGIVGESGSGKSTVGLVLAGFLEASSGSLTFDGRTIDSWSGTGTSGRDGVQMIFQDSTTALNPRMRVAACVAEAIAGGGSIGKEHLAQATVYLDRVGLGPEFARRKPRELSGGQRQRVAIARALAARPRVLVCDESVSALDVSARAKILNLLIRIRQEEGIAMVFISHDLAVVSQLVDRVLVMCKGEILEEGPVASVIDSPQRSYTQQLLAAIPRLERTPASMHGTSPASQIQPKGELK